MDLGELHKMNISERLFKTMKEKGIKARALEKKLNVRSSTVSNWRTRGTTPPAEYLIPICEVLEVSPYFLLTGEESNNSTRPLTAEETAILQAYKACSPERKEIIKGILNVKTEQEEKPKLYDSKIG